MKKISSEAETYVREIFETFPCHKVEGMELEGVGENEVAVRVKTTQDMGSCYPGKLDGGFIGVFTDSPLWLTTMTDPARWGKQIYTQQLNINFFKWVRAGSELLIPAHYIETRTDGNGHPIHFSAAEVKNEGGETVAVATALNRQIG